MSGSQPEAVDLAAFIRKAREDAGMSLRAVEEATRRTVSNGYLSQLESGKSSQPSPHILHALAAALSVDYETLMERAGYFIPGMRADRTPSKDPARSYAISNLTANEERELLEYLSFLRSRRKRKSA